MSIKIHNTLTRKKTEFKPIKRHRLSFYGCGPTVYHYQHLGNMRTYLMNDLVHRVFLYHGYKVKHIINITDVGHLTSDADTGEDKMEKAKQRENKSVWEVADFYTESFLDFRQRLNLLPPTKYVKATECIKAQIKLVKRLFKKGYLYKITDGLYFDTAKLNDYGKLARLDVKNLRAGARIEHNSEKRNITDFVVWKFSPTDKQRDMEWHSPWGKGFPGWHLECSVISAKALGQPFDLHSGGVDHIPVHHTNEIAQSEAACGKPLANYWIHFEHLTIGTEKIAKSSGSFLTLDDLTDRNIDPLAFRYLSLQTHYGKRTEFSWQSLAAATVAYDNLRHRIAEISSTGRVDEAYRQMFMTAIGDDFNLPQALAITWDLLKDQTVTPADKKATILDFDRVLGLNLAAPLPTADIPTKIKELAAARWQAKLNR
ncbi:MAG: cysteine--tRNA ligase, partial [Candidatus Komeilibacteria bacterium]|nr:cysteine--tRNA ligase [Candidatus Komeilibacteria bacterium]